MILDKLRLLDDPSAIVMTKEGFMKLWIVLPIL